MLNENLRRLINHLRAKTHMRRLITEYRELERHHDELTFIVKDRQLANLVLGRMGRNLDQRFRLSRYIAGNPPFAALKGGVRSEMRRGDD